MAQGFGAPAIAPNVKSLFRAIELLNARMNMATATVKYESLRLLIDAVLTSFSCLVSMSKILPGNIYETITGEDGRAACVWCNDARCAPTVGLKSLEHFMDTLQTIRFLYECNESTVYTVA